MVTAANRGKVAEALFHTALDRCNQRVQDFDYERIDDARSSSGKVSKPRTGDFVVYSQGINWAIEVKQIQHESRLPKVNFPRDQRARMAKRALAGGIPVLFVYHASLSQWRMVNPLSLGYDEIGSWQLQELPLIDKALPDLYEKLLAQAVIHADRTK